MSSREGSASNERRRSNTMPAHVLRNLRPTPAKPTSSPKLSSTSSPKPASKRVRKISAPGPTGSILKKQSSFDNPKHDDGSPTHRQVSFLRDDSNPLSSSLDSLETLGHRKSPLPRGSNLYESVMREFGRDEEERDQVSPLPSPDQRRKFSEKLHPHRHTHTAHCHHNGDVITHTASPDMSSRKHIHWSEDVVVKRK